MGEENDPHDDSTTHRFGTYRHNLICISGIAALLAMRKVMQEYKIPGTVVLIGTPAEEGGVGKGILLEKGACELDRTSDVLD